MSRLVDWLVRERSERVSHGLYYNTQIAMGYNSNHMEGSTLTPEQTAQLFTTGSVLADGPDDIIRADDVIEMGNHFRMFDWMLDHVDDPVDKTMVCTMQSILKRGTSQESNPDRNIGGYKILPNVISEIEQIHTVLPADVPAAMNVVYELYRNLTDDPYAIAKAHWMFESTHPLSDGNGRVGRMIMFKELLRIDTVPVVVRDSQKLLYYRGLRNFSGEPGYLVDTLLSERDYYRDRFIEQLAPGRIEYTYVDTWDRTPIERRHTAQPAHNPFIKDHWDTVDVYQRVDPSSIEPDAA